MEQHSIAFFVNTCYPALMEDAMKDEETDERGEEKNIGKKKKKEKVANKMNLGKKKMCRS